MTQKALILTRDRADRELVLVDPGDGQWSATYLTDQRGEWFNARTGQIDLARNLLVCNYDQQATRTKQ